MEANVHFRTCNLCEAMCGLKITLNNKEILKIEGDFEDQFSRGHICPKAAGLKYIYEDPNRLKRPLQKTANGWKEITWVAAFELASIKIKETQEKYGPNAIGVYQGNPSIHNLGTMMYAGEFFKSLKTKNMFTATSTDQLPHHFASWLMFGHPMLIPIPDIDNTDFMLIIGGNPLVSNGSMMSVPDVANRLKAIQSRGGKFVVVDPRKTETAEKADEHYFIKPNADAFLLLAIINVIVTSKKANLGKLKEEIEGFELVEQFSKEYTPESVSNFTGISAEKITQLALDFVNAKSAVCYGRVGVSTQAFGGVCQWLINVLNVITGNLDSQGGAMFALPAIDFVGPAKPRDRFKRWASRVSGLPEFLGELPVAAMAEEILTPGQDQIKLMITSCGNPILSTPNGGALDKAFESLDFMIAFDIYLNETTQHADLILPPATGLENSHYDLTFHNLTVRNNAKYSPRLFNKTEGAKYDWEIYQELKNVFYGEANEIQEPEQKLDLGLRYGPYKMSLEQLKNTPHGVDLGEMKPILMSRIKTENQKINLCPELLVADLERLNKMKADFESTKNTFWLIGRRGLRDNNSWMHNAEKLMKGKNRCTIMMHTDDAKKHGFNNQDIIKVSSRVGSIKLPIEVTNEMMQGVVSMPHGYGHARKGVKMDVATQYAGVSINDLTDEKQIDELTGNSAFSNVKVWVEAVA
jgi:anaerobic selenocysteine-containing dehydrogenase